MSNLKSALSSQNSADLKAANNTLLGNVHDRVLRLCVGHRPPVFDTSNYVFLTSSQDAASNFKGQSIVLADELGLSKGYDGGVLSEYQQLFELQPNIKACATAFDYVHITQYRKFISHIPGQKTAPSMPQLYLCNKDEANHLNRTFERNKTIGIRDKSTVLCGHHIMLKESYASQYSRLHKIDDYLRFHNSIAKACQFDSLTFKRMTEARIFFPTPSLGLIPTFIYINIIDILLKVWATYIADGLFVPREGYQRRVGGFLLERLHSLLYVRAVYTGEANIVPHFQYVIGEDDACPSYL